MARIQNISASAKAAQDLSVRKSTPAAEVSEPAESAAFQKTRESKNDKELREAVLRKNFAPENIDWLKSTLGIDLHSPKVKVSDVFAILQGKVTSPIETTVTPLAFNRETKKLETMPPVKVVASWRIIFPHDASFHQVAHNAQNKVFVASYPCYETLEKSEPVADMTPAATAGDGTEEKNLTFSPAELKALEGIGVPGDILFNAGFGYDHEAILDGDVFDVTGRLRVADPVGKNDLFVNVTGRARLDRTISEDGAVTKVRAVSTPVYPSERKAGAVLDFMRIRRVGNIELDFASRDSKGNIIKDEFGNIVINQAARDLQKYGIAFEPVNGRVMRYDYTTDSEGNSIRKDSVEHKKYQVVVVNGGLCVSEMKKVEDLDKDGNTIAVKDRNGNTVNKYHYEVDGAKVGRNGTVRIGIQDVQPVSERDLLGYRKGEGGLFKGFVFTDPKTQVKSAPYDVWAVPDNTKQGFPKFFSEGVSKELAQRRDRDLKTKRPARKQNYSMGL